MNYDFKYALTFAHIAPNEQEYEISCIFHYYKGFFGGFDEPSEPAQIEVQNMFIDNSPADFAQIEATFGSWDNFEQLIWDKSDSWYDVDCPECEMPEF